MRGPEDNNTKVHQPHLHHRRRHLLANNRRTAQAARAGRAASRRPKPINQNFAAPDSSGTHAPTDQENQPDFFFNDTATTEIYTLSLHDALPIYPVATGRPRPGQPRPPARNG